MQDETVSKKKVKTAVLISKIFVIVLVIIFTLSENAFCLRPISFKNEELDQYHKALIKKRGLAQYEAGYPASNIAHDKFSEGGNILPFYGLTCIAWVSPDSELYKRLCRLQDDLKSKGLDEYFAFLKPSSFHVTICDIDPSEQYKDIKTPVDQEWLRKRSKQVEEAFEEIGAPGAVSAYVQGIGLKRVITALVRFKKAQDLQKVRDMESAIKRKTGASVREFAGHISLAYIIKDPNPHLKEILAILREHENTNFGDFAFSSFDLTYFTDMNTFTPNYDQRYIHKRTLLYS